MQEDNPSSAIRNELVERLRSLEGPQSSGTLAELSYRRAREALERALEESRRIRLEAIDDARSTRERELTALMESMRALRESAEAQIDALLQSAEIEASRVRDQAKAESQQMLERASQDAASARAEAAAIRRGAEDRVKDIERMESDFNSVLDRIAQRLGVEKPQGGWWHSLSSRKS